MGDLAMIEAKFQALSGRLDEVTLRMWAATEARSLGRGGVGAVAKAIGMSRTTIHTALAELKELKTTEATAPKGKRLQSTRKTREGGQLEDRDAQFAHIARTVADYQSTGDPVVSVDTKKKELIGDFKNAGTEWQPKSVPEQVRVHGFIGPELGKVAPYGVYDLTANTGWVNVGIDHDTAEFAVESIRRWWREMGEAMYPRAARLLITADCAGSNGHRVGLWRRDLQKFADQLKLTVQVCHFPPGTSKWNKIEHRMFCHITANWRGRPLISRQVVVSLFGSTPTRAGLRIKAGIDENTYTKGIKVTDQELATLAIERDEFHGEWNYRLLPRNQHVQYQESRKNVDANRGAIKGAERLT